MSDEQELKDTKPAAKVSLDDRFFGVFGLILTVCGLTLPYVVHGISGDDQAGGFAITTLILALTFCIIGRRSSPGRIGLIITGVAMLLILFLLLMKGG